MPLNNNQIYGERYANNVIYAHEFTQITDENKKHVYTKEMYNNMLQIIDDNRDLKIIFWGHLLYLTQLQQRNSKDHNQMICDQIISGMKNDTGLILDVISNAVSLALQIDDSISRNLLCNRIIDAVTKENPAVIAYIIVVKAYDFIKKKCETDQCVNVVNIIDHNDINLRHTVLAKALEYSIYHTAVVNHILNTAQACDIAKDQLLASSLALCMRVAKSIPVEHNITAPSLLTRKRKFADEPNLTDNAIEDDSNSQWGRRVRQHRKDLSNSHER